MQTRPGFSSDFRFRAPPGLVSALCEVAARDCTTASDFVRRAVVKLLRESGVAIPSDRLRGADAAPPPNPTR